VESSDKSVKEHVELVDPSFTVFVSGIGPLKFLLATLLLTPHHIGIGQEIILIINTPHASEVFTTPIATFEETLDQQIVFVVPTGFEFLSQVKLVEETHVKLVEKAVTRPVAEDQENLELGACILRTKCSFQWG
jgi:hypothetical protein